MDTKGPTLLLTGGTGFIGQALCAALIQEGYQIYVLTRGQTGRRVLEGGPLFYIQHLDELDQKSDIVIDGVIHLAGESIAQRWTQKAKENIYNSRIMLTRRLIDWIEHRPIKPRFLISASAVGYYGVHSDQLFSEDSPPSAERAPFSSLLCREWEAAALKAADCGVRTVLLRIGPVLAKEGGILAKLLWSFRWGCGSLIGDGAQWISWIDRDDLIALICFIMQDNRIEGPLNATAPAPVTNKTFSLALAAALHRPCFLKTPSWVLKGIFGSMAEEIMIQGQKVWPEKALRAGFHFAYSSLESSLEKILK